MTDAERAEQAQVVEAAALMFGDAVSAHEILGLELDDAALGDPATLRAIALVVVHTAELRARLLDRIGDVIATYCTLHASVEAVGAVLSGTPIEARTPRNIDLAAVQEALVDVVSPNPAVPALRSPLT